MALTTIEYGSLASSAQMNNNFEYLDNRISSVSESLASSNASIYSNIATTNASITGVNTALQNSIAALQQNLNSTNSIFTDNGLYVVTYTNGSSWYREFFSDSSKTQRVWLEQGFMSEPVFWFDNDQKTYYFIKSFSNTNYTVVATSNTMFIMNGVSSGNVAIENLTGNSVTIGNDATNTFGVRVYACGI